MPAISVSLTSYGFGSPSLPTTSPLVFSSNVFCCPCKNVGNPGAPLSLTVISHLSPSDDTLPPTINPKNES